MYLGDELVYEKDPQYAENQFKGKIRGNRSFWLTDINDDTVVLIQVDSNGEFNQYIDDMSCSHVAVSNLKYVAEFERIDHFPKFRLKTDNYYFFGSMSYLKKINLRDLLTFWVKSVSTLFYNSPALQTVVFPNWDARDIALDMSSAFGNCSSLKHVDFSRMQTRDSLNLSGMFMNCTSLESLDLSTIDVDSNCDYMFYGCKSLKKLKLQHPCFGGESDYLDSDADPEYMVFRCFTGCTSLTEISGGETKKAYNSMDFGDCPLTHESAMYIIRNLFDHRGNGWTMEITFSKQTYSTLTTDDIALATSKSWSIVCN